jgi:hypothetical protein
MVFHVDEDSLAARDRLCVRYFTVQHIVALDHYVAQDSIVSSEFSTQLELFGKHFVLL